VTIPFMSAYASVCQRYGKQRALQAIYR